MKLTQAKLDAAVHESIYWWNRSEAYYHHYLHRFDEIYEDKALLEIFSVKIFQPLLREYSVRRNIAQGTESVDLFIEQLFRFGFVEGVKCGYVEIIDEVSTAIKNVENSSTKNRQSVSLLSKLAFLINPHHFVLYDALAKSSIYEIYGSEIKPKSKLETYLGFLAETRKLEEAFEAQELFKNAYTILETFPKTSAYGFFSKEDNRVAFKLRILDKYLWLQQQKKSFTSEQFQKLSHYTT